MDKTPYINQKGMKSALGIKSNFEIRWNFQTILSNPLSPRFVQLATTNPDSEEYSNTHWLSSETAPKYRLEPPCPPKHVLLHYSAFRLIWDWTILLLTGYTAVVVPLRLAIIPRPTWVAVTSTHPDSLQPVGRWARPSVPESLAIADAVIDIIFCLDIVLNFHTSFVGAGGEVVAEPPVIRINYLSGWFTLDLISCLPYEIIKYCWSSENQVRSYKLICILYHFLSFLYTLLSVVAYQLLLLSSVRITLKPTQLRYTPGNVFLLY